MVIKSTKGERKKNTNPIINGSIKSKPYNERFVLIEICLILLIPLIILV
jgi:hypothetical protein